MYAVYAPFAVFFLLYQAKEDLLQILRPRPPPHWQLPSKKLAYVSSQWYRQFMCYSKVPPLSNRRFLCTSATHSSVSPRRTKINARLHGDDEAKIFRRVGRTHIQHPYWLYFEFARRCLRDAERSFIFAVLAGCAAATDLRPFSWKVRGRRASLSSSIMWRVPGEYCIISTILRMLKDSCVNGAS